MFRSVAWTVAFNFVVEEELAAIQHTRCTQRVERGHLELKRRWNIGT